MEQQIYLLVIRYAASQMSRLPRCGSSGKSADLLCADAGFFFILEFMQSEQFLLGLPMRANVS
jgi:hypothetical protein